MFSDVMLDFFPITVVIPYLPAPSAYWQQAFQGLNILKSVLKFKNDSFPFLLGKLALAHILNHTKGVEHPPILSMNRGNCEINPDNLTGFFDISLLKSENRDFSFKKLP